jgi:DNA modification methylase
MLIAAEMTGRVCLAIDIDSAYVDAVVLRWQNFTGLTATLEDPDRRFGHVEPERRKGTNR